MNVADCLDRNKILFPDREAILFEGRTITYKELWEQANRMANALESLGVKSGDKVSLFLTNCPEFMVAYFACQKLGAASVSIPAKSVREEVKYIINDSDSIILITEPGLEGQIPGRADIPKIGEIITIGGQGEKDWDALMAKNSPEFKTVWTDRDVPTPAAILYTSGTTGKPKGAILSHLNLISNANSSRFLCDVRQEDRSLCFLPLYHAFAQNFIALLAFQAASTLVLEKGFDIEKTLRTVRDYKVTRWYSVPAVYLMVLNHPDANEYMSTVRYCFSASAAMPVEAAKQWEARFGLYVDEGYGMTETSPVVCYTQWKRIPGSVGQVIPDVDIRIADPEGNEVERGQPGEILVKGPNVFMGYYGKPEETAASFVNGWMKTGDVAYMDEEGFVYIVDRLKDMINSAGLKIWPREVEEIIYGHPDVKECAVFAIPHPIFGETAVAAIVGKSDGKPGKDELLAHCRTHLTDYKVPRHVLFMPDLPKSHTGKIQKGELRAKAQGLLKDS